MPIQLAQVWAYRFQPAPFRGKPTSLEMPEDARYWRVTRTIGVEHLRGHWREWIELVNAFGLGEWDLWQYSATDEWVQGEPGDNPSNEGLVLFFKRKS